MRVLIIGRGVVGTIHGWALSEAGIDVTHVVRKDGLPATDSLDILDLRAGFPKHTKATYAPKTVRKIGGSEGFDLVIVATKHYQAVQAIQQYLPDLPAATILKAASEIFQAAGFTLDVKPNIIEWLWVHHAINAGGIGVSLWAGGIAEATRSFRTLRLGVSAVRDSLRVAAARGVNIENYPEAKNILNTPTWLACLAAASSIRFTEKGRRLLRASHFANSTEEMKRFYFDVLNTADGLGVAVPHLASLRERIDHPTT